MSDPEAADAMHALLKGEHITIDLENRDDATVKSAFQDIETDLGRPIDYLQMVTPLGRQAIVWIRDRGHNPLDDMFMKENDRGDGH